MIAIGSAANADPERAYRDIDMKVIVENPRQSHALAAEISREVYASDLTVPEAMVEQQSPTNIVATSQDTKTQFDIKLPAAADRPLDAYISELRRTNRSFSILLQR